MILESWSIWSWSQNWCSSFVYSENWLQVSQTVCSSQLSSTHDLHFQSLPSLLPTPLFHLFFLSFSFFSKQIPSCKPISLGRICVLYKESIVLLKMQLIMETSFLLWLVPVVRELWRRMPWKDCVKYTHTLRQTSYLTMSHFGHHFPSAYTQLHNCLQEWLIRVHDTSLELSSISGLHAMSTKFYQ